MSRFATRLWTIALLLLVACGDDGGSGGCTNPHEGLTPGPAKALSPKNTLCDDDPDPDCEEKDEDSTILLAQDNSFYVAWLSNRHANNDDIYIMRSEDGKSWGDPIRVTTSKDADWYPTLIERENSRGRFHLSWMRQQVEAPFERHIFFNSSPDGVTWDTANEVQVTTGAVDDFVPYLLAHESTLLIYFDNLAGRSSSGTRDLFVVRSTDDGDSWKTPQELSEINSTTEMDSFPYVVHRPFSADLMMVWVRYSSAATGILGAFDASADLFYSTSSDGITWGLAFPVTPGDSPDTTVDTVPSMYVAGTKEMFTWLQGVNNEPHIVEVPLTVPSTYPDDLLDVSADKDGAQGYSVRVTRTAKQNTFIRTFVTPQKRIFYQVFER